MDAVVVSVVYCKYSPPKLTGLKPEFNQEIERLT